jgi:hypothetical protein
MTAQTRTRKAGTGSVRFENGRWVARGPQVKGKSGPRVGRYDLQGEAVKALDKYLSAKAAEEE